MPEIQNVRTISNPLDFVLVVFSGFEISRKHIWFLDFRILTQKLENMFSDVKIDKEFEFQLENAEFIFFFDQIFMINF